MGDKTFWNYSYENVKLNSCFFFIYKAVILDVMFVVVGNRLFNKKEMKINWISAFWQLTLIRHSFKMTYV